LLFYIEILNVCYYHSFLGQLLAYPLNILENGTIESLEGSQGFLDWPPSAKVMGKLNAMIPQKLTT